MQSADEGPSGRRRELEPLERLLRRGAVPAIEALRQIDPEFAALPAFARETDVAAHQMDEPPADGQADARALDRSGFGAQAIERLKHPALALGGRAEKIGRASCRERGCQTG